MAALYAFLAYRSRRQVVGRRGTLLYHEAVSGINGRKIQVLLMVVLRIVRLTVF
jgi:hypothetical protein